ncbi:MAG: amidohydrolase family protein [Burkholderiales bacterium]
MSPFDLLIKNATIVTCDSNDHVIADGALGIRGDRIAYVGPSASLPPDCRAGRTLDATGRVVTPGFINVHTHAILTMVRGVAEDLGFAPAYTPGIPHGHDVTPDEAIALAQLGATEALLFGSTLINDTYVHADLTIKPMADVGLRVFSCGRIHDADFALIGDGRWEHHDRIGDETLGLAVALAERWHGRESGRIGVQFAAHAPDTCSDRLLGKIAVEAARQNLRVNTHLAQSQKEVAQVKARSGKTPAQVLNDAGLLNDRLTAAHCIFVDENDIALCGRASINVAHVPKGNATGGTIAPTVKLRNAGASLTLGTDNMHADMVEVMRWALAVGRVQEGKVSDAWQPRDVLRMATINGARAMGLDHEIGSLELGKKADAVVFDFRRPHLVPNVNPIGNIVHVGQGRDVETVIVDGRVVVEGGEPVLVKREAIIAAAQHAADALWARAKAH